jgi:hypothetical protein
MKSRGGCLNPAFKEYIFSEVAQELTKVCVFLQGKMKHKCKSQK